MYKLYRSLETIEVHPIPPNAVGIRPLFSTPDTHTHDSLLTKMRFQYIMKSWTNLSYARIGACRMSTSATKTRSGCSGVQFRPSRMTLPTCASPQYLNQTYASSHDLSQTHSRQWHCHSATPGVCPEICTTPPFNLGDLDEVQCPASLSFIAFAPWPLSRLHGWGIGPASIEADRS